MSVSRPGGIVLAHGALSWCMDGITLSGGRPSARLRLADGRVITLSPEGNFEPDGWVRDTPAGQAQCRRLSWRSPEGWGLTWVVGEFERRPGFVLQAQFHNGSSDPIRLADITLLGTEGHSLAVQGSPEAWWLMGYTGKDTGHLAQVLPGRNDLERAMWAGFNMPIPYALSDDEKATDGHWRSFRDFVTLYTDKGRRGLAAAAVGDEADVDFDFRVESDGCRVEVISQMSDVVVDPGEWRTSETVALLGGPYLETVDSLNRWIAASLGSRTHRGPLVGWCSWYDLGPQITAEHTVAVAEVAARLRDRIPLDVIQVDDGYQRQVGDWECNDTFPDGWQPVVQALRDAKALPGVWVAPLLMHESVGGPNYTSTPGKIVELHPDWFQRRANGEMAGTASNWGPTAYWLDPTHPGAAAYIRRIIRRLRQEGFAYYKIDFNTLNEDAAWYDPKETRLQAFRDLYRLYRAEIGEDAYLLSCSGLTRGTIGYSDASRIGPDSVAAWREPHPCCLQDCVRAVGSTALANGVYYANDPDVTYTLPRYRMTPDEMRTWHGFVGLLGGLALISEPLSAAEYQADASLRMLEIVTPPAAEKARPFRPGVDPEHQRFGFVAERPWGSFIAALVYNAADQPASVALDLPDAGLLGPRFHAWSFWNSEYCGVIENTRMFELAPHESRLLRLTPLSELPALVGSDLHISLGAAEVAGFQATAERVEIQLTDAGAREGHIYVYSERTLGLLAVEGMASAEVTHQGPSIWCVALRGRRRDERQVIRLSACEAGFGEEL